MVDSTLATILNVKFCYLDDMLDAGGSVKEASSIWWWWWWYHVEGKEIGWMLSLLVIVPWPNNEEGWWWYHAEGRRLVECYHCLWSYLGPTMRRDDDDIMLKEGDWLNAITACDRPLAQQWGGMMMISCWRKEIGWMLSLLVIVPWPNNEEGWWWYHVEGRRLVECYHCLWSSLGPTMRRDDDDIMLKEGDWLNAITACDRPLARQWGGMMMISCWRKEIGWMLSLLVIVPWPNNEEGWWWYHVEGRRLVECYHCLWSSLGPTMRRDDDDIMLKEGRLVECYHCLWSSLGPTMRRDDDDIMLKEGDWLNAITACDLPWPNNEEGLQFLYVTLVKPSWMYGGGISTTNEEVFFNTIFVSSHMYPREPRRDPSNRRLNEQGIYIRHCQESNSQPVPFQAGADTTRPQWRISGFQLPTSLI